MASATLPHGEYLLLASRLIPDLDAGFAIAVLRRARDIAATGARVQLLTFDPADADAHAAHEAEWRRRGLLAPGVQLHNLFDDARADASWLRSVATPGNGPQAPERRAITDAEGGIVLELPVIPGDPAWHLTTAPVTVWESGEPIGAVEGFGALYRAWVNERCARAQSAPVVLCQSRQIGELLVADAAPPLSPEIVVLHETHACHVLAPFAWDSPMDPAWSRWLKVADRFDRTLWLTASQRADVERRLGQGLRASIVPHPAPAPAANEPRPGRFVMMGSLIARKRVDDGIRALATVRESLPAAELHVYGGGPLLAELTALAADLGVGDAVFLHGHQADVDAAWHPADVFVFASTNEGQPQVVLEALGRGVPVVSYDLPYGPADMLSAGGGVLVPGGDVPALAAAMLSVTASRERRAELSAQARARAAATGPEASMRALADAVRAARESPAARPGR